MAIFFAYTPVKTDGVSHSRSVGNNFFGLEDIVGGGNCDFADIVAGLNFAAIFNPVKSAACQ